MTHSELADKLNVSESYVSQMLSGKKKASKRVLGELVKFNEAKSEADNLILSLARLPIPTLPRKREVRHFAQLYFSIDAEVWLRLRVTCNDVLTTNQISE
jgi:transcriptional regulator with XRE-family HTH domain